MKPVPFKKNPLANRDANPTVYVQRGPDAYTNARSCLRQMDLSAAKGKRVLLKPNTGRRATADSGIVTNPMVVAAAIDAFREAGAEVAIGESPIIGVHTMEAFECCGMKAMAENRDCPLIDMDARTYLKLDVPGGVAIHHIKLCADVQDFDVLVSIPVMKMHMHTGVTLSVKNMKGCLWRRSKIDLHMLPSVEGKPEKPLNIAIADMASVLRPHLSLIDGTIGMEGLGPSAGKPRAAHVVVAGTDAFATDAVACTLMGVDPRSVQHLRIAAERGYGCIDLEDMCVAPDTWKNWITPFAPVPENLSFEFPHTRVHDRQSCSACQSTLMLFLKRYGREMLDYFPEDADIQMAIGKGHEELPEGTVCVGNCTREHKGRGLYVSGCPPVASSIIEAIKNKNP